ncbi:DUF1297 domain-containing protein [Patescibacteria group bacterium AH-259-L07]|nr:DUF1297 domain-containing protein [Patescibacteria group bacterium AH-259-L07]
MRIGILGSHSAEEVGIAAKSFGFGTVVICQKGRDKLYSRYNRFLFDEVILLEKFRDMLRESIQEKLRELNVLFIPNRSFSVYVGYDGIENKLMIPVYGNRFILRCEERNEIKNQYWLMEQAGMRIPKRFNLPEEIDRLCIVKVQQKDKPLERAFFYSTNPEDYKEKAKVLIEKGIIDKESLKEARIEEYVLGQKFNANFQGWALQNIFGLFDFVGFDDRKQTNLSGIRDLPASEQLKIHVPIKNEEIGHYGLTMRESKKPLVYEAAEKFMRICQKEFPPGIIGLFALQGAVAEDPATGKLEFYIFDVSPRIPGSPCIGPTSPEMRRLSLKFKTTIETPMDLPMFEIKYAQKNNLLTEIVT